ncbi:MAG: ATP-binding protein [Bacteroidota bacterium]
MNLISTVVRSLIANAIKFTPKNGKITIKAQETETYIKLSDVDTGVEISAEQIDKIFDEAFNETTYGTNAEKGSGLGLTPIIS